MAADPPTQFPGSYVIVPIKLGISTLECPKDSSQILVTPQDDPASVAASSLGHSKCLGTAFGGGGAGGDLDHCRDATGLQHAEG